jgi:hypothetical protein
MRSELLSRISRRAVTRTEGRGVHTCHAALSFSDVLVNAAASPEERQHASCLLSAPLRSHQQVVFFNRSPAAHFNTVGGHRRGIKQLTALSRSGAVQFREAQ